MGGVPELGEHDRCPHCGGLTVLQEHEQLFWVCAVCGGPRIPQEKGDTLGEDVARALKKAGDLRTQGIGWRFAGWATAFIAAIGAGTAIVMAPYSIATTIVLGALAVGLGIAALGWRSRGATRTQSSREAWEKAWGLEIEQLLVKGSLTPKQIAKKLKIEEEEVEKIIARLSATDRVRIDVGAGELRVSSMDVHADATAQEEEESETAQGADARRR